MSLTTRVVERIWFGESGIARAVRGALSPASAAYAGMMRARRRMYDAGILAVTPAAIPSISVGNLTVGGTGKTPVAAWLARKLAQRARPAIVLRGYGGDEIDVHKRLNPDLVVVANADRAVALQRAKALGADVAVLDDAFQHRRIARVADVVLVSAEQMLRPRGVLPAGPWREPLTSARRADLVILTSKAITRGDRDLATSQLRDLIGDAPLAVVGLHADVLLDVAEPTRGMSAQELRGKRVHAIAAIGEPELFRKQLVWFGADVSLSAFPDHHAFTDREIASLASKRADLVVCTLKDAVKLAARWPGPNRLWYVSQQLQVEQGQEHIDRLLQRVLTARDARPSTSIAG